MDRQIIIGGYDGTDTRGKDFYNSKYNSIRCITEYGRMWVPIVTPLGGRNHTFDIDNDRVIIFLVHPDYIPSESTEQDTEGNVSTEDVFGMIVKLPPQYFPTHYAEVEDNSNQPTKILGGSNSKPGEYYSIGTTKSRLILSDDIAILKGPGGQISITNDGIISDGVITVGTNSKYGILDENQISSMLPASVNTAIELATGNPMPQYTIKVDRIKKMVTDILNTVKGVE